MKKKLIFSLMMLLFAGISNLYAVTWVYVNPIGGNFLPFVATDWVDNADYLTPPADLTALLAGDIDIANAGLILNGSNTFNNVTITAPVTLAGNSTFNSLLITGSGELTVNSGITLTITTNMTNAGVVICNGGSIIVGGNFTVDPLANNTQITNSTLSVSGTLDIPPTGTTVSLTLTQLPISKPTSGGVPSGMFGAIVPIPLSPWAVVVGFGLIGTVTVLRKRKIA